MDPAAPDPKRRRGRRTLLVIAVLFALPIVAAGIFRLSGRVPGATANYGTLLVPRPVAAPALAALRGKWVLLQFDGGACGGRCQEKLYYMRQVRRAQGANAHRVERLWVVTDAIAPRAALLAAIAGTRIADAAAFPTGAFPADDVLAAHIWLVDPMGNLMLRFPREPDPGRMVKDLERLLKYSGIG